MIREHVRKRKKHIREVIVYGMVGVTALIVQDILYWVCHRYFGIFPSVSMILGSLAGMVVAYIGHVKYTFKKHRYSKREFVKFLVTSMVGMCINVGGVRFITKVLLLTPDWGLVPTLIAPFVTFLISKFWAFR